jgi:hypothetical protein
MARKRKPLKQAKGDKLAPLRHAPQRPWYHGPLTLAANGVAGLLAIFRRSRPQPIAKPRATARRRRKK